MKFIIVLLTSMFFFSDCTSQKENINETKKTIFGDQKLKDIHSEFIKDCKSYHMYSIAKKHLRVIDYQPLGFGYWGITFPESAVIVIDTTFMDSKEILYVVVYHELAHFYLKAQHERFCGLCIMQPKITEEDAKKIYDNIEFHKQWLLRSNYLTPYLSNELEIGY